MTIINFKGCKSRTVEFNQEITNMTGANETGKSTIVDAFLWCLFGKNAMGKSDFSIKNTKDTSLNRGEHSVEVVLVVDGEIMTFKRIFREIWRDVRSEGELTYQGNETKFFWNQSPIGTLKEYTAKVEQIINLEKFKLLTNPLYFNSLPWESMRTLVVGLVNENEFDTTAFESVIELTRNKSVKELKTQLAATKKENDKVLKEIPARIDEKIREKVEPNPELPTLIQTAKNKIIDLEKVIESEVQSKKNEQENAVKIANQKAEINAKIDKFRNEYRVINYDIKDTKNSDANSIKSLKTNIENAEKLIEHNTKILEIKKAELSEVRQKWTIENAKEFVGLNENDCKCPTCKREFESDDIIEKTKEFKANFDNEKQLSIKSIKTKGDQVSGQIKDYEKGTSDYKESLINLKKELSDLESKKYDESKLTAILEKVEVLQKELAEIKEPEEIKYSEIVEFAKADILVLKVEIEELQKQQIKIENNNNIDKRIAELEAEQKRLAQLIANDKKIENQIQKFENAKMDFLQNKINEKFKDVSFSMFNKKIDGETELTCVCLYKGVPFADANNGGKINCGLEIIDVFSKQNDTYLPIFVDNKESVDNLFTTNCQIINLIVDKNVKVLQIE